MTALDAVLLNELFCEGAQMMCSFLLLILLEQLWCAQNHMSVTRWLLHRICCIAGEIRIVHLLVFAEEEGLLIGFSCLYTAVQNCFCDLPFLGRCRGGLATVLDQSMQRCNDCHLQLLTAAAKTLMRHLEDFKLL